MAKKNRCNLAPETNLNKIPIPVFQFWDINNNYDNRGKVFCCVSFENQ